MNGIYQLFRRPFRPVNPNPLNPTYTPPRKFSMGQVILILITSWLISKGCYNPLPTDTNGAVKESKAAFDSKEADYKKKLASASSETAQAVSDVKLLRQELDKAKEEMHKVMVELTPYKEGWDKRWQDGWRKGYMDRKNGVSYESSDSDNPNDTNNTNPNNNGPFYRRSFFRR